MSVITILILLIVVLVGGLVIWTRMLARTAEQLVPMNGTRVDVPGGSIHYLDLGPRDAQPLVLIHGLAGQMHNFNYALSDILAKDFRVIVLDRPGSGYSTRDSDDLAALPEQVRMIDAFLDKLDIQNPVLVGHSMGGAVSLAMALERPDKVRALALLAPLTQATESPPDVFKPLAMNSAFMRRLIGNTIAVPMGKYTAGTVLAEVFKPEPAPDDFLVRGGGAFGMRPQSFVCASADLTQVALGMENLMSQYKGGLKTPGGILYGTDDALLAAPVHGKTMQSFGLDYEELPGRGHMILVTAPDECADFIRRMVAKAAA